MDKKIVRIKESDLRDIVKESIEKILEEGCLALNYGEYSNPVGNTYGEIDEMARINVKEPKGSIFPYDDYDVHIWSNDHEPAHLHIITSDWDVEFYISTGELYKIKKYGKKQKVLTYMCENLPKWLSQPCAALPSITNQQNANLQWLQLHPPKA